MRSDAALNSNPAKFKSPLKTSTEFMEGVPVPKLFTYDQVQSFINTLDMGPVYDLQSTYGLGNGTRKLMGFIMIWKPYFSKLPRCILP